MGLCAWLLSPCWDWSGLGSHRFALRSPICEFTGAAALLYPDLMCFLWPPTLSGSYTSAVLQQWSLSLERGVEIYIYIFTLGQRILCFLFSAPWPIMGVCVNRPLFQLETSQMRDGRWIALYWYSYVLSFPVSDAFSSAFFLKQNFLIDSLGISYHTPNSTHFPVPHTDPSPLQHCPHKENLKN